VPEEYVRICEDDVEETKIAPHTEHELVAAAADDDDDEDDEDEWEDEQRM